jgi:hypothetical protein
METTKTAAELAPITARTSKPTRGSGVVKTIDFHVLTRSMQERFAACSRGEAVPKAIALQPLLSRAPLVFGATIVAASIGLIAFIAYGLGNLSRLEAIHRASTVPIYFACIAAITLGIAQLAVIRMRRRALPFVRGTYVFPVSLVDARDELVRVFSLADVQGIDRDPSDPRTVRVVVATGEVFRLVASSEDAAVQWLRGIEGGRDEARVLRGGSDDPRITWMFTLDPLQRPRLSSPLGPRAPLARRLPSWSDRAWIIAPVAGLLLAPPLRTARNLVSDSVLYSSAKHNDDAASFRSYIALGGRNSDHVRAVLLPRAELHDAERVGTVQAIDEYRASHPNSAIEPEVMAARRKALLDELDRAKKVRTVPALHAFAAKWPDHGLEPELRDAMHSLFAPALDAYRRKPPSNNAEVRSFAERLFAWSEGKAQGGSAATTIQIRFRRKPSASLRRADRMVSEHHWFIGEASYPTRYFDKTHAEPREKAVGARLAKRVAEAFGPNVFTVEQGIRLEDGAEPLPQINEPTLFVTHSEEWNGLFDGSITKPRGIWIATTHRFEATFMIPGDQKPLAFEFEVAERIPEAVIKSNPMGGTVSAPLEDKIYGAMSDAAFKKFEEKYLATFLPTSS